MNHQTFIKKADSFVRKLTPKVIVEEDVKDFDQAEDNEKYDYIVDLKAKSASLTQKVLKSWRNIWIRKLQRLRKLNISTPC